MKTEWIGNDAKPNGYGVFSVEGGMTVKIHFDTFTDYWHVVGIINQEVKRIVKGKSEQIRRLADDGSFFLQLSFLVFLLAILFVVR